MRRFVSDKRGVTAIYAIIWTAILFPIIMFMAIDGTHYVGQTIKLKSVTDNAANAAVQELDESQIPYGILAIDETRANAVTKTILMDALQLDDTLTPDANSVIFYDKPTIQMTVVNGVPHDGMSYITPQGEITLKRPSVIIYAEYPIKGLFISGEHVTIKKLSVAEVRFFRR